MERHYKKISLVVAFGFFIPLTLRIANNNHQTKATTEKAKIMQVLPMCRRVEEGITQIKFVEK